MTQYNQRIFHIKYTGTKIFPAITDSCKLRYFHFTLQKCKKKYAIAKHFMTLVHEVALKRKQITFPNLKRGL